MLVETRKLLFQIRDFAKPLNFVFQAREPLGDRGRVRPSSSCALTQLGRGSQDGRKRENCASSWEAPGRD